MSAMDAILQQAAKYSVGLAFRSGLSIAGAYAVRQVSTYLSGVPKNAQRTELEVLSKRLDQKIQIVTPAIDLIEIIAARGNTTLNSTVQLTVSLRNDINAFGKRMTEIMEGTAKDDRDMKEDKRKIAEDIKSLLGRIEDTVPLISLALTTSGANLSASLPSTVSPSRLLQASSALQAGDTLFEASPEEEMQVGPSFSLKLYTIFEGHSRRANDPNVTNISWQETYAKAILEVIRMPMAADVGHDPNEFGLRYFYHFRVTEDLADGRFHDELDGKALPKDSSGHIRGAARDIPVHNVARLFFSASGRLLNIDEARTPVLVLKINHALQGPSASVRTVHNAKTDQDLFEERPDSFENTEVAPDDLEWLALELWQEDEDDGSEEEYDALDSSLQPEDDEAAGLSPKALDPISSSDQEADSLAMQMQVLDIAQKQVDLKPPDAISSTASLSLLEYILRLAALQTSEQRSLLTITDERISLFLRDEAGQNRSRSQEADAIRRKSNDPDDTPASYDDLVPGTQRRRKSRSSRSGTPGSSDRKADRPSSKKTHSLHTPKPPLMPGTAGSRRWQHPTLPSHSNAMESPLVAKSRDSLDSNLFQSASDLEATTNNGFASRLRHSVETNKDAEDDET